MRELHDNIDVKPGIFPAAAATDNTAFVSQILDMQGLQSAEFIILTGSLADADATFTVLAEEGEQANLSDNRGRRSRPGRPREPGERHLCR